MPRDACRSTRRFWQVTRAAAALALLAAAAHGHRAASSLTTIGFNPQTGNTEIVHRLHTHDAELGVGTVMGLPRLSVLSLEGRAHIALYVEERFLIEADSGPLRPALVGAEVAGDFLLVYQELPGPLPGSIRVRDDILRDVFPEQINQVNIDVGGTVRSLVFGNDDDWRRFETHAER